MLQVCQGSSLSLEMVCTSLLHSSEEASILREQIVFQFILELLERL